MKISIRTVRILVLFLIVLAVPLLVILNQSQKTVQQKAALSNSKLGVFMIGSCPAGKTILNAGPKVVKFMDPQNSAAMLQDMRDYKRNYPNGIVVVRIYEGTPNKHYTPGSITPQNAAQDFWDSVLRPALNKFSASDRQLIDYVAGTNEWDNTVTLSQDPTWVSQFWAALATQISNGGFKPLIGEISVGNLDEGAQVDEVANMMGPVKAANGLWSYHSYGGVIGTYPPGTNIQDEQWTSLRYRKFYAQRGSDFPDMIIGEAGIDKGGNRSTDGWQSRGSADDYKAWLTWFDGEMKQDSYILGATLFEVCDPSGWPSFDLAPIADWFAGYLNGTALPGTTATLPAISSIPGQTLPLGSCSTNTSTSYTELTDPDTVRNQPVHPDRPANQPMETRAAQHADYNLNVRAWQAINAPKNLIDYGPVSHTFPPLLSTLLEKPTSITSTHQVFNWNWPSDTNQIGTQGSLLTKYPVTLIGLQTNAGDIIRLPDTTNQPVNVTGEKAFVIFANQDSITLKYTREDNVVQGYTIHLKGITVNNNLLSLYNSWNSNGRVKMPAVKACQVIGTAQGNELLVAIRDNGDFLDPRSAREWWGVTAGTPIPTTPPVSGGSTPTRSVNPTVSANPTPAYVSAVNFYLKDEAGNPVDPTSGEIYVDRVDPATGVRTNKDSQYLGQIDEECFRKLRPGIYSCGVKRSELNKVWYAGVQPPAQIQGFSVINAGYMDVGGRQIQTRKEDGAAPFVVYDGETKIINITLRSNTGGPPAATLIPTSGQQGPPSQVPNCWGIQGPNVIQLGQTATYKAYFASPSQTDLSGIINAIKTTNGTPTNGSTWDWNPWPPKPINASSGLLSFDWTPTTAGTYQVFCRAWNDSIAECRGLSSTVDGPPRYPCVGPGASIFINVTSVNTPVTGINDMCSFAITVGGTELTPQTPVTVAAIAKPSFAIKTYNFSFYNMDNNNKPIYFTSGTPYIVNKDAPDNQIPIRFSDMDKPDLNNNGKKPTKIKVQANFTELGGNISDTSEACAQQISVLNPTPTYSPSTIPTPNTQTGPVSIGSILAVMGVLIIVIIISLNFFFS